MANRLYYGDNLGILREHIADESVDLIYLDPPFNSNASYNVLFKAPDGSDSQAQIEAFEDTWHWNETAEDAYWQVLRGPNTQAARMLEALRGFLGENDMMAYLAMMSVRLIELHRVLKPTGSLYLHCDPTASHYLKILLDAVFGARNYQNEIVWRRYKRPKGSQHKARRYGRSTDTILFYSKSDEHVFHLDRLRTPIDGETVKNMYPHEDEHGRYMSGPLLRSEGMGVRPNLVFEFKGYTPGPAGWRMTKDKLEQLDQAGDVYFTSKGTPRRKVRPSEEPSLAIDNLWTDIEALSAHAKERLRYPTQKPVALLERIIAGSSNEGDVVLDPFCGCGTTVHAAQKLGREWIGIDVTHLAISLIERRLREAFSGIRFQTYGVPTTIAAARNLAERDKHEFEKWAVSLIPDAQPWKGGQKGADTGIDGIVYLRTGKSKTDKAIIEVKGGGVSVDQVHKLKSVIEREKALMGLFLTLKPPTKPMVSEAASAGFVEVDLGTGSMRFPRLQLVTIEDLLNGIRPRMPIIDSTAFRKAKREVADTQEKMDL